MKSMLVKEITVAECYPIRLAVLRPGKTLADCRFNHDEDSNTFHLGVFYGDDLACIGSFYTQKHPAFSEQYQWQLRGMATLPEYRGKGLGRALLLEAFKLLEEKGIEIFWCNARTSATDFYLKMGLTIQGREFILPKIGPHVVMFRR